MVSLMYILDSMERYKYFYNQDNTMSELSLNEGGLINIDIKNKSMDGRCGDCT